MQSRIKPIDGLRAIAALGVVWIHVWGFYANPAIKISSVDLYQLVAILGNGVDFFFVISGFCMYLMAAKINFSAKTYLHFLYKRFLRIAPAFYVAVVVYALLIKHYLPEFDLGYNVFFHFLFLNNIVTGNTISGPFWSIGTEWHFYLVLPVLIYFSQKLSIVCSVILFSIISLIFFGFVNLGYLNFGWWEQQIIIRFPEFGLGIIGARYFLKAKKLPSVMRGIKGIIIALTVMYAGRLMKFTPVVLEAGNLGFILKTFADFIMTAGFALLLFHVITEKSRLANWLSGKLITYLGRISYSIYLWHSLSILMLSKYLLKIPFGVFNPILAFILISILTFIISHFSYKYLEAFYFKKTKRIVNVNSNLNSNKVIIE